MMSSKTQLPLVPAKVPVSQVIRTLLFCLLVFFGLAKLVSIPLRTDDFDSFRLNPTQDDQSGVKDLENPSEAAEPQ
ncbi:uncharacterized protein LOC122818798 [Drosophila biarmipes]|uniref:uncharacterized protein LOC122818798 n=1 Tax=Drosophila biarmipes TaxID=125945 RepID=UPI001CDB15FE|nr:uncharacterized protein LOC122818798 [Drosophila biarmipes]XP_050741251.1 uncharacterized protein LOC122818798 [Drosophila biarmipes]XP_050741252.1 uncharacterized protein LOC122818798 [Drosophila biarmipes]